MNQWAKGISKQGLSRANLLLVFSESTRIEKESMRNKIQLREREGYITLTMFSLKWEIDKNGTITHQNTISVRMTAPALVCEMQNISSMNWWQIKKKMKNERKEEVSFKILDLVNCVPYHKLSETLVLVISISMYRISLQGDAVVVYIQGPKNRICINLSGFNV